MQQLMRIATLLTGLSLAVAFLASAAPIAPSSRASVATAKGGARTVTTHRGDVTIQAAFGDGDVFVGVAGGRYQHYTNAGVYLEDLVQGADGFTTGCACDSNGDLHTTNFSNNNLYTFDQDHPHPVMGVVNTAPNGGGNPESIVFDSNGNYYVGNAGSGRFLKYSLAGGFLGSWGPPIVSRGTDWIDLALNQQTMFYTSEDGFVRRYDLNASAQLPDFANVGGICFALRLLPPFDGTGGLMVANTGAVYRLDGGGNVAQVYDVAGEDCWFSLNLDPNGTSFWAGDYCSSNFYRFNILTGAIEVGPINTGTGPGTMYGICLKGEITGGICANNVEGPNITAPSCGTVDTVLAGTPLSIGVSAADPDSGDTVSLSATYPAGASFSSASGNPATGTLDWTPTEADSGAHTVTLYATDGCNPDTCSFVIVVITNRPPDCSGAVASETTLWPPNHKYRAISILGVTDPDGDPVTITVTGVTQDEPVNTRGDGNTCPDAQISGDQASVRAERTGTPTIPGNGRVYAISFVADDGRGGQCEGTVTVCVPHDQADPTCIDDGQRFNSLGPCTGGGVAQEGVTQYSLSVEAITDASVSLVFSLAAPERVQVAVFDVAGRRVETLENAELSAGVYHRTWNMTGIAKGLYFVRMQAGGISLTKTVLKIR